MLSKRCDKGGVLLAILILIVMGTIGAMALLSTSRVGIKKAGSVRSRTSLEYIAETGLNVARLRLEKFEGKVWDSTETDPITPQELVDVCTPTDGASDCEASECTDVDENPPCPRGYPGDTALGDRTENVICNFMGEEFENGRVVVVRKDDFYDIPNDLCYAQFLVNVIAYDSGGIRRKVLQAVFIAEHKHPTGPPGIPFFSMELAAKEWFLD